MGNELIWPFLHISLTTSFVIALLLLAVPLLRKSYQAKWRYYAWLVIALRLLIPLNIALPKAPIQIQVPDTAITEMNRLERPVTVQTLPVPDENNITAQPDMQTAKEVSPAQIVMGGWMSGAVMFFFVQAIAYIRFRRRVRYSPRTEPPMLMQSVWTDSAVILGSRRTPELQISAAVSSPVIAGLLKPVLLLPHVQYSEQKLHFIFRHELVHYQRHDLWYKLILTIANGLHWFNPLVYLMAARAGTDIEISCDDRVMEGLDDNTRAIYGEVILGALPIRTKWSIEPMLTTSFSRTKRTIKQRLTNLFDQTRKRKGIVAFCAMLLVTGLIGSLIAYTPVSAASGNTEPSSANTQQASVPADSRLKLVEREFTTAELTSQGISGVEVVVPTENVLITRGGNTLKFSYYQISDSEYDFTTVTDGGGTRTYWALLRMVEGSADDPLRTIHIMLPQDFDFKTIIVDTGSGDISLNNCSANGIGIHTRSQSGNISLVNCSTGMLLASSVNGDIKIQNMSIESWGTIYSDTGKVLFQPQDDISNYHFDFSTKVTNTVTVNGKSYAGDVFELNENALKHISIESGYTEDRNKKIDENGQGTASFTIKDQ